LDDAVIIPQCQHTFCKTCISGVPVDIAYYKKCPECRMNFSNSDLQPPNLLWKRYLRKSNYSVVLKNVEKLLRTICLDITRLGAIANITMSSFTTVIGQSTKLDLGKNSENQILNKTIFFQSCLRLPQTWSKIRPYPIKWNSV